jgi:hypothetical protein
MDVVAGRGSPCQTEAAGEGVIPKGSQRWASLHGISLTDSQIAKVIGTPRPLGASIGQALEPRRVAP